MRARLSQTATWSGYGLALTLAAIAAWGGIDLWAQWRALSAMIPAGWECSGSAGDVAAGWLDPCDALVDGRRRMLGVACVYAATVTVSVGLAALVYRGRLATRRLRVAAWIGVMLICATGLVAMATLTLVNHPMLVDAGLSTALRLVTRETPMLAAVVGMLTAAAFVLLPKR